VVTMEAKSDSIELVMRQHDTPQLTDKLLSKWRYKHNYDAEYYFLFQLGTTIYYRAVNDTRTFEMDVNRWLESYERVKNEPVSDDLSLDDVDIYVRDSGGIY